jgi:hypothetical protein
MGLRKKTKTITNRAELKRFILAETKALRPSWGCCRVSGHALDEIESFLRSKIIQSIHRQPSVGKTFMSFY